MVVVADITASAGHVHELSAHAGLECGVFRQFEIIYDKRDRDAHRGFCTLNRERSGICSGRRSRRNLYSDPQYMVPLRCGKRFRRQFHQWIPHRPCVCTWSEIRFAYYRNIIHRIKADVFRRDSVPRADKVRWQNRLEIERLLGLDHDLKTLFLVSGAGDVNSG